MHQNLVGFDKQLAVIYHHEMLLGTFFASLDKNSAFLQVTTNVNNVLEWDYVLPLRNNSKTLNIHNNIYTNVEIVTSHHILKFKDSWMVRSITSLSEKDFSEFQIRQVKNSADMEVFLQIFSAAYFENNKKNLIATNYHRTLLNSYKNGQSKLIYFYMADGKNNIVGVSALAIIKKYCFSYCIGIHPAYRGRKLSTLLLDHHSLYAKKYGCDFHILQTEYNSYAEDLYVKNHFALFETMHYYLKL